MILYKTMEAIYIVEMEVLIRFQIDILNGTAILRAFGYLSNNRRGFLCPLSSPGQRSRHILSRQTGRAGSVASECSMAARILWRIWNTRSCIKLLERLLIASLIKRSHSSVICLILLIKSLRSVFITLPPS